MVYSELTVLSVFFKLLNVLALLSTHCVAQPEVKPYAIGGAFDISETRAHQIAPHKIFE